MSNIKNPENLNDRYSQKPSGTISDSDKFGYQPTRSSGEQISTSSQQTTSPPRKP
ncbi:hypothetical protein PYR77_17850 (plasmid) [Acinetobacter soli]|uniref:hypothetical protein n=1 Tax=Acinetobacter bereziniae TaxID=106648 RepID=UPI0027DAB746|nr:hypothetical protein [Acinetobacter soli]WEH90985.1 hypothetical protein PYR75_00320 [Acinetobacter soli]WEI02338.1 hypothetical protein PYR77_17850 [Acinetobacter soli]